MDRLIHSNRLRELQKEKEAMFRSLKILILQKDLQEQ